MFFFYFGEKRDILIILEVSAKTINFQLLSKKQMQKERGNEVKCFLAEQS